MGKELSEMTLEELWELFPIILKEHNPEYKNWYLIEKNKLSTVIGKENIARINHIGSSAVKDLIAKPTIDILLELTEKCNIEKTKHLLQNDGWILMWAEDKPDMKMLFNKGYNPDGFAEKVYHLHIRYLDDWDELYFRDYLISHNEISEEYGKLKMSLIDRFQHDRDCYTNAKSEFILKYSKQAREEFSNRYALK